MKTSIINLRVDKLTKDLLEKVSSNNGVNISTTIRRLIINNLEDEIILDPELAETKNGLHLVKTIGFTEFVFWIYHKYIDPEISEIDELYIQFIDLIDECRKYPIFNAEVMTELEKVSRELNRHLYDKSYWEDRFKFPHQSDDPFNYTVFACFMYMLRYDDENRKVIHCKW